MPPIAPPRPRRAPKRPRLAVRLGLPALVAAQTIALSATLVPAGAAPTAPAAGAGVAVKAATDADRSFTVVTANMRSPQSRAGFLADTRTVYAQSPDLVTFNEVAFRADADLAPAGYELWRTPGSYLGPTPVAWRSSVWSKQDQGTFQISDYAPKPPGRTTRLGMRYVNWVTLRSRTQNRVLSVVAAHLPPPVDGMPDLLQPSLARLSTLVTELGERGPVIVGGDFNVHLRSQRYPAQALAAAGLRSTYELAGEYFPTGDHGGFTIDYLFVRGSDELQLLRQRPVELNSDHDAVVADLSWTGQPVGRATEVRNDPQGSHTQQRVVLRTVLDTIRAASDGDTVRLSTRGAALPVLKQVIRSAQSRGVRVQLTTRSPRLTGLERALARSSASARGSWVRQCRDACAAGWRARRWSTAALLSGPDGAPRVAVEASRRLQPVMLTRRSRAITVTDAAALAKLRADFRSFAGRR